MSLNNYQIKLLAAILMLIDHAGVVFFPEVAIFRIIGRFSFPLFILLLVDGERYTRNFRQYCLRLLILGLLSQPIYWLLFRSTQWNILFLLLLGLLALRLVRQFPRWQLPIWLGAGSIAQLLPFEYRAYGIAAIALIHQLQDDRVRTHAIGWGGWIGLHLSLFILTPDFARFQFPAILVPLLLALASHQPGAKARWFYLFYPLHLLALWLLQQGLQAGILV